MKLLRIAYLGTNYHGFQVQPNGITVQQCLCEAAEKLFGKKCDVTGCSRTDSGVHANEFYCTVKVDTKIPNEKIVSAFNFYLPKDITVNECFSVDESFHPRYNVNYKEYVYLIWNGRQRNPFYEGRMFHYPYLLDEKVMNDAAQRFIGKKDFAAFMAEGSSVTDTVREIKYFNVTRDSDIIKLTVAADGFLYNMVRILTGTLIYVSEGKIKIDEIENIITSKNRKLAGFTVPPEGLYLNKVIFK